MASKDNVHGTKPKNQTNNQTPATNTITSSKSDNNTSNQPTQNELQINAAALEEQFKKDKLNPNMIGIVKNKILANTLQSSAIALEQQQRKDKLNQNISNRKSVNEMYESGKLQNKLQSVAITLEQQQKKDKLNKQLNKRSKLSPDDLQKKGIKLQPDDDIEQQTQIIISSLSPVELNDLRQTLEEEKNTDNYDPNLYLYLNEMLDDNYNVDDIIPPMSPQTRQIMEEIFIDHDAAVDAKQNDDDNVLKSMAASLEKNFSKSSKKGDLIRRNIIKKSVLSNNNNNNNNIVDLDIQIISNKLSKNLEKRQSLKDLKQLNILKELNQSAAIQQTAQKLKLKMKSDTLKQNFAKRTNKHQLHNSGILQNPTLANALQGPAMELEKRMQSDMLKKNLLNRSNEKELLKSGILKSLTSDISPSIQQQMSMIKDKFDKRASAKDLKKKGIIKYSHKTLAPSLHQNALKLEDQFNKIQKYSLQTRILQKIVKQQQQTIILLENKNKTINLLTVPANDTVIDGLNDNDNDNKYDDNDNDITRFIKLSSSFSNELLIFRSKYNIDCINNIKDNNILINSNSLFNYKLHKYSQILINISQNLNEFNKYISDINKYISLKCIPDVLNYINWNLNDILTWIKYLEKGRYIKYISSLSFGFKESDILTGDELPDLSTADLSAPPFNIKIFRDKRDLIKHFKNLKQK